MKIKAVSLWQPWASLVALGAKRFETRSWKLTHRGPLLICSSRYVSPELIDLAESPPFAAALAGVDPFELLGKGLAFCQVEKIHLITPRFAGDVLDAMAIPRLPEMQFGDFKPGRFAWQLDGVRAIANPFNVRGSQGVFEVDIHESVYREMSSQFA